MTRGAAPLVALVLCAPPARAAQVFLREPDAARALFGEAVTSRRGLLELSDAQREELSRRLGRRVEVRSYPYLEVFSAPSGEGPARLLGHVFVIDVVGQSLPITFAVGVRSDGTLQDVQVMVYRETHGDEIRERRFRAQFTGKSLASPLVVGKDIDAITGATISSRSASYAARKALALAEILRRDSRLQAPGFRLQTSP
jgi:hypothetical protein